jgi:diaminopimelate decarboxylase
MTFPLQFFHYKNGILSSEGIPLTDIAKRTGTPVYVYSTEAFLNPLRQFQEGLKDVHHLICFAVKANSNISVLRLLAREGAGMDLVSGGELVRAEKANVAPQKIVFSGVGKTAEEMKLALHYQSQGIYCFNVESLAELTLLNEVALSLNLKAPVALRFNPDVDPKTHPYISTGLKKNKFGIQKSEIFSVVQSLNQFKGIQLKGLSIHIGSQLLSLSPLDDAFKRVGLLLQDLDPLLQKPLEFLDLGGGIGITYHQEKAPSISKYCQLIQKHFRKRLQADPKFKILIEPGRTISGNAGVLLSTVIYRKERKDKDFLVVDAAMNDLLRPALYESYHEIIPVKQTAQTKARVPAKTLIKTSIVGPVCESSDCFASNRPFPKDLKPGDLVAILSAGAYGFSMASNYNSRPRPPEVLIDQGEFKIVRRRETYEDLTRGED